MPVCFQLFKKGSSEAEVLTKVDEAICEHLGVPCDPVQWRFGWYDLLGFKMAMGASLGSEELREFARDCDEGQETPWMTKILAFLEENYTNTSWREVGKR